MKLHEDPPPEITHPAHPAHKLRLVPSAGAGAAPFRCDGCKEPGEGPRYTCACPFDLHTCCALPEKPTLAHPLFSGREFKFLDEPPAPAAGRLCDACGDDVRGFVYHCAGSRSRSRGGGGDDSLDLHPCCATLQESVTIDGHVFTLAGNKHGGGFSWRPCAVRPREEEPPRQVLDEMARRSWEEAYRSRVGGGGGGIVMASEPFMRAALQSLPTRSSSGFGRLRRILQLAVGVIIAVVFGNPLAMIAAIAGPGGVFRG
ncbi:hypothetical protein ACP4OV_030599 [Aristida adscensionis]